MRNTTINTTIGNAVHGLANVIVVGGTSTLRDLCERFARGIAAAAGYRLAALTRWQPAGHSWHPEMCLASMPARSQRRDRRRASGVAVKRGAVGVS